MRLDLPGIAEKAAATKTIFVAAAEPINFSGSSSHTRLIGVDRVGLDQRAVAGLEALLETPHDVEAVHREKAGKRHIFVLNHTEAEQRLDIPEGWTAVCGEAGGMVQPYAAMVFVKQQANRT